MPLTVPALFTNGTAAQTSPPAQSVTANLPEGSHWANWVPMHATSLAEAMTLAN